jgi:hypothetical protein
MARDVQGQASIASVPGGLTAMRVALLDFQLEAEIPRTGELDETTRRKLRELYGS